MSENIEPEVKMVPMDVEVLAYDPKSIKDSIDRCKKNIESYETAKSQQVNEIEWLEGILTRRHALEAQGISIESLKRAKK
jgi:hypothetical protein